MADPYPFYRRLRDEAPAYHLAEYDAWALSRFEDVWKATEDAETFVTARGTTAAQALSKVESPVPSINQMDGEGHTRLRKAIRGVFSRASQSELRCANWMPLARSALYAQGEDLHVAIWPGCERNTVDITRFIAAESRSYVISASTLLREQDIPADVPLRSRLVAPGEVTLTKLQPDPVDQMVPEVRFDQRTTPLVWARLEDEDN